MNKRLIISIALIFILLLGSMYLYSQSSRNITISDDFEEPEIDVKVEVKKQGEKSYTPVELKMNEDCFFDMPYALNLSDKFKVSITSKIDDTLYTYILNVTPESKLRNIFPDTGGFELMKDQFLQLPSSKQSFSFSGSSGKEIFIILTSKFKLTDTEAESLYQINELEDGSREIIPIDDEPIYEKDIRIYGIYIFTH